MYVRVSYIHSYQCVSIIKVAPVLTKVIGVVGATVALLLDLLVVLLLDLLL